MSEPVTRNCHYPQLVRLPAALLQDQANLLDVQLQGHALQRVASRDARGRAVDADRSARTRCSMRCTPNASSGASPRSSWSNLGLSCSACVMIGLGWTNRREAYLGYFGWLSLAWALMSLRLWWRDMPWDNGSSEFLFCTGFAPLVALAVQFLLSYADLRSRWIENALALQWVLLPVTLLLGGPGRLFGLASAWYVVLAIETFAVMAAVPVGQLAASPARLLVDARDSSARPACS
jgi:hypothetical protein